jgi:2',3'-cyclic-nucleotide 2'-phosphodiesterase
VAQDSTVDGSTVDSSRAQGSMRILFLGDIVGKPGVSALLAHAADLRASLRLDAIVANGENAADGTGMTLRQFDALMASGVDGLTMGDHVYRKRELMPKVENDLRIVRPANYPAEAPGRGWTVLRIHGHRTLAIIAVQGRIFMRPVDCPLHALEAALASIGDQTKVVLVDVHAEATSEKQLIARHFDGRVSAVLGTHTHVATADLQILPGGTAFQCDVGMCGPHDSIIGRAVAPVLATARTFEPHHYHVATDDVRLNGVLLEIDPRSGRTLRAERFEKRISV